MDDAGKGRMKCRSCGQYMAPHPAEKCSGCRDREAKQVVELTLHPTKPKVG